ncbi:MAG: hypothetical protein GWN58_13610 [Anaerolineae bacterium]|nr:hypothetical protein [Anaerolineae bacterium]
MNPTDAPQRVSVISRTPVYADESKRFYAENPERQFAAIGLGGKSVEWADAPVEWDGNLLLVNGLPYRHERQRESRRHEDWIYYNDSYRLQTGWQVLLSSPLNPEPHPNLQNPTQDRAEAEITARQYVTQNRSAYNSKMVGHVVWQESPGSYGDPVATCDGAQFTREEAARSILKGEWLPFTYIIDEAGDAPTSPASRSNPSNEGQEPTRTDDTIIRDLAQVRHVSPQWGNPAGTNAQKNGRCESWDSRPFEEIEALVQSLGWRPIGKHGTYWNPKFDAEAARAKAEWEQRLAAMYGTP